MPEFDPKAQMGYHMVLANLKDKRILGRYRFEDEGVANFDRKEYLKKYPMYHQKDIVLWIDTWGWVEANF